MKTKPTAPSHERVPALAPATDAHRYRAERPSLARPRRVSKMQLQRWLLLSILALLILALFASPAAASASTAATPAASPETALSLSELRPRVEAVLQSA